MKKPVIIFVAISGFAVISWTVFGPIFSSDATGLARMSVEEQQLVVQKAIIFLLISASIIYLGYLALLRK